PSTAESVASGFHLGRMALLGRRVAELHRALCQRTGDPAFDPEPLTAGDFAAWKTRVEREIDATLDTVQRAMPEMPEHAREKVAPLVTQRDHLHARVRKAASRLDGLMKTRYQGDLH